MPSDLDKIHRDVICSGLSWVPGTCFVTDECWFPTVLMCVQTLMDPDKRAAYDALMGFTSGAMNPFNDKSYTPDKVFVSEYDCIGALISLALNVQQIARQPIR